MKVPTRKDFRFFVHESADEKRFSFFRAWKLPERKDCTQTKMPILSQNESSNSSSLGENLELLNCVFAHKLRVSFAMSSKTCVFYGRFLMHCAKNRFLLAKTILHILHNNIGVEYVEFEGLSAKPSIQMLPLAFFDFWKKRNIFENLSLGQCRP